MAKFSLPGFLAAASVAAGALYLVWGGTNKNEPDNMARPTTAGNNTGYPNTNYTVRGYRNNNPLNIVQSSGVVYSGEIQPSTDSRFRQFTTMAYGYRAAFMLLKTYKVKYNIDTVAAIIDRWCPGDATYTPKVCSFTGFTPSTVISYNDRAKMTSLVNAMSKVENGGSIPVPVADIETGWNLYKA